MTARKPPIHIRRFVRSDVPSLYKLFTTTWQATYQATLGTEATQAMLSELEETQLQSIIPNTDEATLVAVQSTTIVGTLTFAERNGIAYLWGMYVLPDFQRQGVGTLLMQQAKLELRASDCIEVRVMKTSLHATSFYRKLGFTECGHETTDLSGGKSVATIVMTSAITLTK